MTYRELAHELAENLDKLQKQFDRWEASEQELEKYRAYVKKTLYSYRIIEWKQKENTEQNLEVVWVEKK